MSITIQLSVDLEQQLLQSAKNAGTSPDEFVVSILKQQLNNDIFNTNKLEETESSLLLKINKGLKQEVWEQYNQLIEKRDDFVLTSEEHQQLIDYSDQIEETNAERVRYLLELAQLRKVSLDKVMLDLGIKNQHYA